MCAEIVTASQELVSEGRLVDENFSRATLVSKNSTKDISEIFAHGLPSGLVLIEGAPGIGKRDLSKEIALQWATKKLLYSKKLAFLLFLRDPVFKDIYTLESLVRHMISNTALVLVVTQYLLDTEGKDLVIIFDGYDEMSEGNRDSSFLARIINREILLKCDLVVTSRPTALVRLRADADCRVEVLGFTEENRLDYIKHALQGSDHKIKLYLQSNPTINALCYIPLNMTILVTLFEEEGSLIHNLPATQTGMYQKFILMTIVQCLKRNKQLTSLVLTEFSSLPKPHKQVFDELCQLALILML